MLPSTLLYSFRMASQFLRKLLSCKKQSRFHGSDRKPQHFRDFFQRVALHRREQKHEPVFLRKFFHGAVEMLLKFARGREVFRGRPRRRL